MTRRATFVITVFGLFLAIVAVSIFTQSDRILGVVLVLLGLLMALSASKLVEGQRELSEKPYSPVRLWGIGVAVVGIICVFLEGH